MERNINTPRRSITVGLVLAVGLAVSLPAAESWPGRLAVAASIAALLLAVWSQASAIRRRHAASEPIGSRVLLWASADLMAFGAIMAALSLYVWHQPGDAKMSLIASTLNASFCLIAAGFSMMEEQRAADRRRIMQRSFAQLDEAFARLKQPRDTTS